MSGLFGGSGSSKNAPESFLLTGGGTGAPWNFGVSPFDQSSIDAATADNTQAIHNRYKQLGLGGSTMEGQDVAGAQEAGTAMTGQLQTQNESNPALNPALQPQLNSLIGSLGNTQQNSTLSSLASAAGLGSSLSNLLGGGTAAAAGGTTLDSIFASLPADAFAL